jgi:hypothetical protein
VNEGHRAIESCVERERCEMRVEWIEVWTLLAVRYTCFILVYFIAREAVTEAPNPCSGHILAPIP